MNAAEYSSGVGFPEHDELVAELAAARADAVEAWRQVHLLKAETNGPDGFATWKDAATDERVRRVKAEAEAAKLRAAIEQAAHKLELARVWGGMKWEWVPAHPVIVVKPTWDILRAALQEDISNAG